MSKDKDKGKDTHESEESSVTEAGSEGIVSKEQELEAEVGKLKEQLLRTLAELDNYRKRAEREKEDTSKYAVSNFARELLSVSDNLRRAIESVPEKHENPEKLLEGLLEGVKITETELLSVFSKHKIEKIDPLGKPFDHQFHQAMFEVEDSKQPPGIVVQVLQPGYTLYSRLLRPAFVGVSKGKKSSDETLNSSESLPT